MQMTELSRERLTAVVQAALDALRLGGKKDWRELLLPSTELFDDGGPRGFTAFTEEIIEHWRFTKTRCVTNEGRYQHGKKH